jgi:predicted dehydrogenase
MNRQDFLKTSAFATAGLISRPFITYASQSKFKVALIGSGWWGTNILREAVASGEVEVIALCDADEAQMQKCQQEITKWCTDKPKKYKDFRECIRQAKPDIVINATPDHWHALIAIEALNNGAHVFLEKPISHTLKEGTAIQKAARNNNRICIVDFHRRYSPHNVSGMQFLKSGKVGKIREVKAFVNYTWGGGQPDSISTKPDSLDWDLWCGPAPLVDYSSSIHPRGWRHFREFGNGQLGDWGPHWFDQILWWTEEKAPKKIFSVSTDKERKNTQDTPENQLVTFEFEDFICQWEHSTYNRRPNQEGENVGVYFHGENGTFHMGWMNGWAYYPHNRNESVIKESAALDQPDGQNIKLVWADLLNSIKTGKLPKADIEQGRQATNMCMLGMVSDKLGRSIEWDQEKDSIVGDQEANMLLSRNYRNGWVYPA